MNIGIYSPYLDTLTGGEKYIFTAASCLSKEHNVTIFWDDPSIISKAEAKFQLDLSRINVSANIFNRNTGLIKRFYKTFKFDRIFYLSDGSIPIVGAKKLFLHFQFPVEWVNTNSFLFLFKKSRVSKFICNSYFTKRYIDRKFNTKSFVLYPPATIRTGVVEKKENLILTVGRYSLLPNGSDFKKLEFLVGAFKKFQKKRLKGWKFAIVTSVMPEHEKEFEKFVTKSSSNYIEIHKNIGFEEITKRYSEAKIYWHAAGFGEDLEKYPERAEHFGISTVEAMSHGAVPIVVKAGGQIEIIKESENGFMWENEAQLLEKTHKVAVDKDLYIRISKEAMESSKSFSLERFCEELNHLIW